MNVVSGLVTGIGESVSKRNARSLWSGLEKESANRSITFLFSSRRRHTIFDCDWSSDVCSSDLIEKFRPQRIFHVSFIDGGLPISVILQVEQHRHQFIVVVQIFTRSRDDYPSRGPIKRDRKSVV